MVAALEVQGKAACAGYIAVPVQCVTDIDGNNEDPLASSFIRAVNVHVAGVALSMIIAVSGCLAAAQLSRHLIAFLLLSFP